MDDAAGLIAADTIHSRTQGVNSRHIFLADERKFLVAIDMGKDMRCLVDHALYLFEYIEIGLVGIEGGDAGT